MRRSQRLLTTTAALVALLAISLPGSPATAITAAPLQPFLSTALFGLAAGQSTTVMVHGTSITTARTAVAASGMRLVTTFNKIGVAVAKGSADQVRAVARQPGVTYVEGNQPIEMFLDTSHVATRGSQARATLTGPNGTALDGRGVSVAVIDSGIDPTHPFFRTPSGGTAVVRNLKSVCLDEANTSTNCVLDVGTSTDTDTLSVGGHGTHVSGIVAGRDTTLTDGTKLHGAAPGAALVSISTGAVLLIIGADSALNWVLENHRAPCGAGVSAAMCPPIKVTNNSYGPVGGGEFDPNSATAKLQRALAAEGVMTVWANGNDGDNGDNQSNPPGLDPTPGVVSVASYFDRNTGTRDGAVSEFSSRGDQGRTETYPDISAPGEDIESSCRPYLVICATGLAPNNGPGLLDIGTFNTISGTSMAAPHIAGIIAQLFQAKPSASPAEVEDALKSTAYKYSDGAAYQPAGPYTTSYDKGTGLVDVVAAAQKLGATAGTAAATAASSSGTSLLGLRLPL